MTMNTSPIPTTTYLKVVTSTVTGNRTLQTNILRVIPTKITPSITRNCMRLGVVVVEIHNHTADETNSVYDFHDMISEITLLRK